MRRIKGFTLAELLIAMIISSIAVLGAQSAYQFTIKSFLSHKAIDGAISNLVSFNAVIKRDLDKSMSVFRSENGFKLEMQDDENILYNISKTWIERYSQGQRDTFRLPTQNWSYTRTNTITDHDSLISGVAYQARLNGEMLNYYLSKHYSAFELMQEKL